jgi:hypothetical protein
VPPADEHYVPTLLAVHGQDQRTTCSDALTAADWVPGLWSPLIHTAADVNADLVFRWGSTLLCILFPVLQLFVCRARFPAVLPRTCQACVLACCRVCCTCQLAAAETQYHFSGCMRSHHITLPR